MITKRGGKIFFWALCIGALNAPIQAVVEDYGGNQNPYSAIWLRNAFDLKPATGDLEAPKPNLPPPNVQLTGITTILGNKRALFMVQQPPAPGKPPGKEQSFIMTEGERQGALEVLEINTRAATVKIRNDGVLSTIALTTNKAAGETTGGGPINGTQGVPRARAMMQPLGNPGFMAAPISRAQPADVSAFAPQGNYLPPVSQAGYAQPGYPGGFQTGYAPPSSAATPAPAPGNSAVQTPSVSESSPAPVSSGNPSAPMITSQMQAAIAAAEAAAADGHLAPPPLPAGVSVQTAAEARAGAPAPPNFPTPPPLPSNIMGLIK